MDLTIVVLSEVRKNDRYHMISFIGRIYEEWYT